MSSPKGPTNPESVRPCGPDSHYRLKSPEHREDTHRLTSACGRSPHRPPPAPTGPGLLILFRPESCFLGIPAPPGLPASGGRTVPWGTSSPQLTLQQPPSCHTPAFQKAEVGPRGQWPLFPGDADSASALRVLRVPAFGAEAHRLVLPGQREQ